MWRPHAALAVAAGARPSSQVLLADEVRVMGAWDPSQRYIYTTHAWWGPQEPSKTQRQSRHILGMLSLECVPNSPPPPHAAARLKAAP